MGATATTAETLRVVTTAAWVAADLGKAGALPVVADYGLELPAQTEGVAWWCSGRHAARMMASGVNPGFLSAGPTFTADLPWWALRRRVWAGPLKNLPFSIGPAFYKPAEAKIPDLPARKYDYSPEFQRAAAKAKLDAEDFVQVSAMRWFSHEYRCFIANGQVTAVTPYLAYGVTWESLDPAAVPGLTGAEDFATRVVDHLGAEQPPGYVLDVGVDESGRFCVIEANASWSSNPYHADPAGAVASILASQSTDPAHDRWRWEPTVRLRNHAHPLPAASGARP